jgi:hypothetical protein
MFSPALLPKFRTHAVADLKSGLTGAGFAAMKNPAPAIRSISENRTQGSFLLR